MATLNEVLAQIEELKTIKSDLKEAIVAQGGEINDETLFVHYPYIINNLDNGYSFGLTIDDFLGDVDENGALQPVDNKKIALSFDLLTEITTHAGLKHVPFHCSFYHNDNIESACFTDLIKISGSLLRAFGYCSNLKYVIFDKLETITSTGFLGYAFVGCVSLTTMSFPKLINIDNNSAFDYMFSECTQIEEIHFRADMQTTIEAMDGYSSKFGASNATVYFDL